MFRQGGGSERPCHVASINEVMSMDSIEMDQSHDENQTSKILSFVNCIVVLIDDALGLYGGII